jgi:hypothetical protein
MKFKELKQGLCFNPIPHIVVENYADERDYAELTKELIEFEAEVRKNQDASDTTLYAPDSPMFKSGSFFGRGSFDKFPTIDKFYKHFASSAFHTEFAEVLAPYAQGRLKITPEEIIRLAKAKSESSDAVTALKLSGRSVPRVRLAHVDNPQSIMVFLHYLRLPNDTSTGGDLLFHGCENSSGRLSKVKALFRQKTSYFIKAVDYKPNTLLVFMNGPDSIHEVTPRKNINVNRIAFQGGINAEKASF